MRRWLKSFLEYGKLKSLVFEIENKTFKFNNINEDTVSIYNKLLFLSKRNTLHVSTITPLYNSLTH